MQIYDFESEEMRGLTWLFEDFVDPNETLSINYKSDPVAYQKNLWDKSDPKGYILRNKEGFAISRRDICPDWIDLEHDAIWVGGKDWPDGIPDDKEYDLIIGDFPFGLKGKGFNYFNISDNLIAKALTYLSPIGHGLFITTCTLANDLRILMPKSGFHVNAIFKTPDNFSKLFQVSMEICLVDIRRYKVENIFYGELLQTNDEDWLDLHMRSDLLLNYFDGKVGQGRKHTGKLDNGLYFPYLQDFLSFRALKASIEVGKLQTLYSEFDGYELAQLAKEFNAGQTGKNFQEKENSIYIPKVGTGPVVSLIAEGTMKHQNYHQVVLNKKAINDYICCFYQSKAGKLSLETVRNGVILSINKANLSKLPVPLPDLETQKKIVAIYNTLNSLQTNLDTLKEELAVNPMNVSSMEAIEDIASTISGFTSSDNLRSIIRGGESKTVEFKETFSLDIKTQQKEKYIELSSLKTIDGFLNAKGGKLFIGVNDDQEINGIDEELKKFYKGNEDKYLLHFKNKIDSHIDIKFADSIDYEIIGLDGKKILLVECLQSDKPCWIKKDFYVRTGPSTVKLEGPELYEYIENHFNSNKGQAN
jgi:hypothetical protein